MDGRKLGYWILQVIGAFLATGAIVYIGIMLLQTGMFGSSFPTAYYLPLVAVLAVGLVLIVAGSFLKPKTFAETR